MLLRPETEAAIRAAGIAQRIADSRQGAGEIDSKGGIDLVTRTDLHCEDAIRAELTNSFPDYEVIGEERGGLCRPGKAYWLVDPICGTRPFASNIPLYCTNIALVEGSVVTVAAIGVGKTGEIVYAERGRGAYLRKLSGDERIAVRADNNTLWIDGNSKIAAEVTQLAVLKRQWFVWRFSTTLAYAYLAMGRIAGVMQFSSNSPVPLHGSVHVAAGCLAAIEAGAIVTDAANGNPWALSTQSFLMAATAQLHRELTSLIQEVS